MATGPPRPPGILPSVLSLYSRGSLGPTLGGGASYLQGIPRKRRPLLAQGAPRPGVTGYGGGSSPGGNTVYIDPRARPNILPSVATPLGLGAPAGPYSGIPGLDNPWGQYGDTYTPQKWPIPGTGQYPTRERATQVGEAQTRFSGFPIFRTRGGIGTGLETSDYADILRRLLEQRMAGGGYGSGF